MDAKVVIELLRSLLALENLPEDAKQRIEATLAALDAAASGETVEDVASVEEPVLGADKPADEADKPPMGMKQDDYAKVVSKAEADAQAKAVKALVERLPLADGQRAYAAKLRSVEAVEEYIKSLPKAAETPRPKLGMDRPVQGGDQRSHFAKAQTPSPDAALNRMMRVFPKASDGNFGIRVPENKASEGKLIEFSITDALPDIRSSVAKNAGMKEGV